MFLFSKIAKRAKSLHPNTQYSAPKLTVCLYCICTIVMEPSVLYSTMYTDQYLIYDERQNINKTRKLFSSLYVQYTV